jgi:perosamine synthetase
VIPVNEPLIGADELALVQEAVSSGWISSSGPYVEQFERAWADYCGRKHGISVCNGTAALEAAMLALELAPGDEVILPTFTILSCVIAVLEAGATPVLVDADPETWCMDAGQTLERLGPRTRVIMPVHIYGHPVELEPVLAAARSRGIAIVEDAAEAHGAEYRLEGAWRRCGSFGDLSTFSFFANKLVTTGEGGMVVTDDDTLATRLREIRNLGFGAGRRFLHERLGRNFRLTSLQAALGLPQVSRMAEILSRKREIAAGYATGLASAGGVRLQTQRAWARSAHWMVGIVLDDDVPVDAEALAQRLRERGVETRPFFLGMHEQPVLQRLGLFGGERFPVSEKLARRGLYLPSGVALTDEQQQAVCAAVLDALA